MRGIFTILLVLATFGAGGTVQAQQPLPKQELKALSKAIALAANFSRHQNEGLDRCLMKSGEVDKLICARQMIEETKKEYAAMIESAEKMKPHLESKSELLKYATRALDIVSEDARLIRLSLENCSRKLEAKDQLSCFQATDDEKDFSIHTLRLAYPIAFMLDDLAQ